MGLVKYFLVYSVCAVAFALVVYAADKHCYVCDDDTTCNDPFNTSLSTTNCTLGSNEVCGKYSFRYNKENKTKTVRGCVADTTKCDDLKTSLYNNITDNSTWSCYTCTTDLCNKNANSATSFGVSMVAVVAGAIVSLYFK